MICNPDIPVLTPLRMREFMSSPAGEVNPRWPGHENLKDVWDAVRTFVTISLSVARLSHARTSPAWPAINFLAVAAASFFRTNRPSWRTVGQTARPRARVGMWHVMPTCQYCETRMVVHRLLCLVDINLPELLYTIKIRK